MPPQIAAVGSGPSQGYLHIPCQTIQSFIYQTVRVLLRVCERGTSHRIGAANAPVCVKLARMVDPKLIDDLARRLSGSLPAGLRTLQDEIEQNFRPVLQSALSRLDLVTREEFDVQSAVLAKARKQLDTLLARLQELEAHLNKKASKDD